MKKILSITLLFFWSSLHAGTNYYVAASGSNSNNGLAPAAAFGTVTYAATVAIHGDTINIMGGTYFNANFGNGDYWKEEQTIRINNKNSATGNYLVIRPYNHEQVILKGDGNFIFQIRNSSYIRVEELELFGESDNIPLPLALGYQFAFKRNTNTPTTPIEYRCIPGTNTFQSGLEDLSNLTIYRPFYFFTHGVVVQGSHHISIENNLIHHLPGEGVRFVSSDYVYAIGNEIHNCSRKSSNGGHGMSCYTLNSIDNYDGVKIIFSNNLVHDNYCQVASWSELKTIFNPVIDEGKGMTIQRTFSANGWLHGRILIENNIAFNNGLSGIHINEGDRIDIINNTLYNNSRYGDGNNLGISAASVNDVKIYNNIITTNLSWGGFSISTTPGSADLVVSNNLVNGGLDPDIDLIDVNTIVADPLFADTFQFQLKSISPAINNALNTVAPALDFYSISRDADPDRGAAEYNAPSVCYSIKTGIWNNPAVWSCGHVPFTFDEVTIAAGHTVIVNKDAHAKSLDVYGILNIQPARLLRVKQ
ncbi:MAG: right-handed parallel beta-helix repeat-containing protein [Ferruginibacter sp.]